MREISGEHCVVQLQRQIFEVDYIVEGGEGRISNLIACRANIHAGFLTFYFIPVISDTIYKVIKKKIIVI